MSLRIEGHLTSKSSPLAPVSCKLSKQFIVQQHLNAHYKNISNVKPSVDNKCPKSWYKHTNTKDQLKKEKLLKSAREIVRDPNSSILYPNKSFRSESQDDIIVPNSDRMLLESKPITPKLYKNDVKSKIAQLRCYNAPKKKTVIKSTAPTEKTTATVAMATFSQPISEESHEKYRVEPNRNEEKDLRYLSFCKDITNDILENNIFTNRGINKMFDEHIAKNKYNLPMSKMLIAYDQIRLELDGKGKMSVDKTDGWDRNNRSDTQFHDTIKYGKGASELGDIRQFPVNNSVVKNLDYLSYGVPQYESTRAGPRDQGYVSSNVIDVEDGNYLSYTGPKYESKTRDQVFTDKVDITGTNYLGYEITEFENVRRGSGDRIQLSTNKGNAVNSDYLSHDGSIYKEHIPNKKVDRQGHNSFSYEATNYDTAMTEPECKDQISMITTDFRRDKYPNKSFEYEHPTLSPVQKSQESKDKSINEASEFDDSYKSREEDLDQKYLSSFSKDHQPNDDHIMSKNTQIEYSAAPSVLQGSLTSIEDYEAISKLNNSQPTKIEEGIAILCEELGDVQLTNQFPQIQPTNEIEVTHTNEDQPDKEANEPENNVNRNVHFANHNEVFSATESEDHSLTDVTSMRLEESDDYDDENNDSTCVESSLDLNKTFKSDAEEENLNAVKYEDDFDD